MTGWKAGTQERNSRVREDSKAQQDPEYHETRETLWETGGTTLQA